MKYRVTCLTPTLVGDGSALSPIDYMVWKDQVNVLDQNRIFKLLAKGPRLDGYLTQIRRAERLDFASWGGFAQNFAGRRIPFDHPSSAKHWEALRSDQLFIPTFATQNARPYLPGSALRGALRTALLASRVTSGSLGTLGERPSAAPLESQFLGKSGSDAMRAFVASDSTPVGAGLTKAYLVRVSALESRGPGHFTMAWKQTAGGPQFAEMAPPGVTFEGGLTDRAFARPARAASIDALTRAANRYSAAVLHAHRRWTALARLPRLDQSLAALESRLQEADAHHRACLLPLGWGTGYLGKTGWPQLDDPHARRVLGQLPYYAKAIRTGLPFPKTRRVVFLEGEPAALPGWVLLEIL